MRYKRLTLLLFTMGVHVSGPAWASAVDDFRRGGTAEIRGGSANMHTTGPFGYDRRDTLTGVGVVELNKDAGSLDVTINFAALGFDITVPFTGETVDGTTIRFTTSTAIDRCVVIQGAERFIKRVSGTLTMDLMSFMDPMAGTFAPDYAQRFEVRGGGEGDPLNSLHITADSGCGDVRFSGDVNVHDILIEGMSGRFAPDAPVSVARFAFDDPLICPAPVGDKRISGRLSLAAAAPRSGVTFSFTSSDPAITDLTPSVRMRHPRSFARVNATIPDGYRGTFTVTAHGPSGVTGASASVTVTNGLDIFAGGCVSPFLFLTEVNVLWQTCLACEFLPRLRGLYASAVVSRFAGGHAYTSAASEAGVVGYSLLDGRVRGMSSTHSETKIIEDAELIDVNNAGIAVGTRVDPNTRARTAMTFLEGVGKPLPASGQSEALYINDDGDIVGHQLTSSGTKAVVWRAGKMHSLHPQGAISSRIVGLTEDGLVSGTWVNANKQTQSFTFDLKEAKLALLAPPQGYDGVELLGATRAGYRVFYLTNKNGREVFVDYGKGKRKLAEVLDPAIRVERVIAMDDAGRLLALATVNGNKRHMLLGAK